MSTNDSTSQGPGRKEKPEGSPFYWHKSGRWAKRIRGKIHYFGRGSHEDALAEYERKKADLHAGRQPREEEEGLTVYALSAKFLIAKKAQRDNGELSPRSFLAYGDICKRIVKAFGRGRLVSDLTPADFAKFRDSMAKVWGPVRLKAEIIRTRTPFHWAYKSGLLDRPIVFGEEFKPPTKKVIRKHRAAKGPRMFEANEIRAMLAASGQPLKCMILLGINAGFSNSDCAALTLDGIDLAGGWLNFAREKTGIMRHIPLWPETVEALRDWLKGRPAPAKEEHAQLVFLTKRGDSWAGGLNDRPLAHEIGKVLKKLGIEGSYYNLRHGCQTVGDERGDFLAVRHVMGHATSDIADAYRERMSDERLRRVTDHIRQWLFAEAPGDGASDEADEQPGVIEPRRQAHGDGPQLRLFAG